jgi:hypothetical protein
METVVNDDIATPESSSRHATAKKALAMAQESAMGFQRPSDAAIWPWP